MIVAWLLLRAGWTAFALGLAAGVWRALWRNSAHKQARTADFGSKRG
jgi:hypothetical protein